MAATEGIRSSFSTQPIRHSPKLRVYEYLFLLSQKLQEAVQILKQLEKCPWLRRDFFRSFQVEVEDLRAQTNSEVIERMSEREKHDWPQATAAHERADEFRFSSWRTALEKTNGEGELSCSRLRPQTRFLSQTKPCRRCIRRVVLVDPQYKSLTYTVLVARGFSAA
jgi:hypothetical protein